MKPAYIIGKDSLTITLEGVPKTVLRENEEFNNIINAIKEQDWDLVLSLVDKISKVKIFIHGDLKVEGNQITYNGEVVHGYVIDCILNFIEDGFDVNPLLNFLEKLMNNPSKRCVDDLYSFLEHGNMPIDPDGDFYAYKAVKENWTDKYTGTIDNHVGQIVSMPRNKVQDDPENACSHGLHAGTIEYVKCFGEVNDKIIIVKINPKDVVSVPSHETTKLRCCKYEVVQEYTDLLPRSVYKYNEDNEDNVYDEDEDEYDED